MTTDLNVLVAAFRADHPHHSMARAWRAADLTLEIPVREPRSCRALARLAGCPPYNGTPVKAALRNANMRWSRQAPSM